MGSRPTHPSHTRVTAESGPRPQKVTLQSKNLEFVRTFLTAVSTTIDRDQVPLIQQEINSKVIREAFQKAELSRVLLSAPPNSEEISLPRFYRTTLSELRAGKCFALNDYRTNIGLTTDPSCPNCGSGDLHTTSNLKTDGACILIPVA